MVSEATDDRVVVCYIETISNKEDDMLKDSPAFSGFSVNDLAAAKQFYGETLGLNIEQSESGLQLKIAGSIPIYVYHKDDHQTASFTIINFPVDDIDLAVDELSSKGIEFIQYDGMTDDNGIARGISANRGPDIAWFKDPAGNFLSILHND